MGDIWARARGLDLPSDLANLLKVTARISLQDNPNYATHASRHGNTCFCFATCLQHMLLLRDMVSYTCFRIAKSCMANRRRLSANAKATNNVTKNMFRPPAVWEGAVRWQVTHAIVPLYDGMDGHAIVPYLANSIITACHTKRNYTNKNASDLPGEHPRPK